MTPLISLIEEYRSSYEVAWLQELKAYLTQRSKSLSALLSEEKIDGLTEKDLFHIFNGLVTVQPLDVVALVRTHGFEAVREHLKNFLYGSAPLEERFDIITASFPEVPQLAFMEVATLTQPRKFCIWDEDAKRTIVYIGHRQMHGLEETAFGEKISGLDYVFAKLALNHLREVLSAYMNNKMSFIDVYLFTRFAGNKIRGLQPSLRV
jgi:hypothetical protein